MKPAQLPLIPYPAKLFPNAEMYLPVGHHVLTVHSRIAVTDSTLLPIAAQLRQTMHTSTGLDLPIEQVDAATLCPQRPATAQTILLWLDPELSQSPNTPKNTGNTEDAANGKDRNEAYQLHVTPVGITVHAAAAAGVFYGIQTLLQLLPPAIYDEHLRENIAWVLPCVSIEDAPRFSWRGAMLDCGRHFFPVTFIKKFIDQLARHKLNTFHWHLTEDQGWRLQIRKYPRLTEVGSVRSGSSRGSSLNPEVDSIPHSGFYTQADVREIVAYATERFITVVPEIELPGHATAAIAAYPELGCLPTAPDVATRWGVHEHIYNIEESTFTFLQDVFDEVIELFPSHYIHIGGDEAIKPHWKNSPRVQDRMKELGIKDENALQSYFINRIGNYLASKGRSIIGWDEIIEGGIPKGATVMAWLHRQSTATATAAGHDVICAWRLNTYLDYYQSPDIHCEPLAMPAVICIEKAYSHEPIPDELPAAQRSHVIGTQAQIWTEFINTPSHVEYMAFPRLCALAEVAWGKPQNQDFSTFSQRLDTHLGRLAIQRINFRRP